jgi:selenium-binding protein 1
VGATLEINMATWIPDPTFYASPRLAAGGYRRSCPASQASIPHRHNDEMAVVDLEKGPLTFGQIVGRVEMSGATNSGNSALRRTIAR